MTFALARSLLLADAVTPDALSQALLIAATRGTSLVRALLATQAIDPLRLEQQLERGDAPFMRHVAPVMALVQHLPPGLCDRLLALPVRRDPRTGHDRRRRRRCPRSAPGRGGGPLAARRRCGWCARRWRRWRRRCGACTPSPSSGMRTLAPPIWVPSPPRRAGSDGDPGVRLAPFDERGSWIPTTTNPDEVHDAGDTIPNIPFALTREEPPRCPSVRRTRPSSVAARPDGARAVSSRRKRSRADRRSRSRCSTSRVERRSHPPNAPARPFRTTPAARRHPRRQRSRLHPRAARRRRRAPWRARSPCSRCAATRSSAGRARPSWATAASCAPRGCRRDERRARSALAREAARPRPHPQGRRARAPAR